MTPEQKASIKSVLDLVALAFAILALAKLLGVHTPYIPGTIEQLALVGIACKMA